MLIRLLISDGPQYLGYIDVEWDTPQTMDYFIALAKAEYPDSNRFEVQYVG
jgi:hypothetical protein